MTTISSAVVAGEKLQRFWYLGNFLQGGEMGETETFDKVFSSIQHR